MNTNPNRLALVCVLIYLAACAIAIALGYLAVVTVVSLTGLLITAAAILMGKAKPAIPPDLCGHCTTPLPDHWTRSLCPTCAAIYYDGLHTSAPCLLHGRCIYDSAPHDSANNFHGRAEARTPQAPPAAKPCRLRDSAPVVILLSAICYLLSAIGYAQSVTLAWNPNSETNLAGYYVYQGTTTGQYPQRTNVGLATTHTLTNLARGLTYYWAVTAYNTTGLESDPSKEVSYQVPKPPDPPQNLRITATLQAAATIAGPWTNVATLTLQTNTAAPWLQFYRARLDTTLTK
jgi:hypothetical protein